VQYYHAAARATHFDLGAKCIRVHSCEEAMQPPMMLLGGQDCWVVLAPAPAPSPPPTFKGGANITANHSHLGSFSFCNRDAATGAGGQASPGSSAYVRQCAYVLVTPCPVGIARRCSLVPAGC
jgi:hypothetical protein